MHAYRYIIHDPPWVLGDTAHFLPYNLSCPSLTVSRHTSLVADA